MKWYHVFIKSLREQIRDYWILALTLTFAPFFVFMYYLMAEAESPVYDVVFVNHDQTAYFFGSPVNLGDSLVYYLQEYTGTEESIFLEFSKADSREKGVQLLKTGDADVMVVLPADLTPRLINPSYSSDFVTYLELVGDITDMDYIIGAIWTEELINQFILEATDTRMPVEWKETTLGHSGHRTEFELYVPGLMIFSIIMMMFTASASIVREPEAGTLERLKISNLTAFQYLTGISLIQVIIGIISLLMTIAVAVALGYEVIPGTLGFILLIGLLTSLSMISFSLIVAAICRSIKDVAIIGTFPLILLMFFSGAFFPLGGGRLFAIGNWTLHLNDFLSPTWAVDALNKVLIKGLEIRNTLPEMLAILVLTLIYFLIGVWAFQRRHMRAA
ncbi:ABC transporter permease [Bacteroidota bacterium]